MDSGGLRWKKRRTRTNHEYASTWFLRATLRLPPGRKFEDVLEDQKTRQTTSLQAASYIAFACSDALGPDSENRRPVQVEMLGWLGESVHPEVEHLEAEPIHPGRNKPFTSHETIKQFYAETTREEPRNGKRHLEIYLASGEDVVGKAGRPKGSTKAARAAADACT